MTNGEIIRRAREGINKVEYTLLVLSLCVALVEFGYAGAQLDFDSASPPIPGPEE